MKRGELRACPECRRPWPKGAEHDLRGFGWLDDLPRHVTPTNIDCLIHDGAYGRDRYLYIETKGPREWPDAGQSWALRALAGQSRNTVRLLRAALADLTIHRVGTDSIERDGRPTTAAAVRLAVVAWLNGSLWRDAESSIALRPVAPRPAALPSLPHCATCGAPASPHPFPDGSPRFPNCRHEPVRQVPA